MPTRRALSAALSSNIFTQAATLLTEDKKGKNPPSDKKVGDDKRVEGDDELDTKPAGVNSEPTSGDEEYGTNAKEPKKGSSITAKTCTRSTEMPTRMVRRNKLLSVVYKEAESSLDMSAKERENLRKREKKKFDATKKLIAKEFEGPDAVTQLNEFGFTPAYLIGDKVFVLFARVNYEGRVAAYQLKAPTAKLAEQVSRGLPISSNVGTNAKKAGGSSWTVLYKAVFDDGEEWGHLQESELSKKEHPVLVDTGLEVVRKVAGGAISPPPATSFKSIEEEAHAAVMSKKRPRIVIEDDNSDDEEAGQVESLKNAKTGGRTAAGTNID